MLIFIQHLLVFVHPRLLCRHCLLLLHRVDCALLPTETPWPEHGEERIFETGRIGFFALRCVVGHDLQPRVDPRPSHPEAGVAQSQGFALQVQEPCLMR